MAAHLMTTTATPTHPTSTPRSRHQVIVTPPTTPPVGRWSLDLSSSLSTSTSRLAPLRGSKRLHQLSKMWADSREVWALTGVQTLDEFMKYDADLWRKMSAYKGLGKSSSYCFEQ